MLLLLLLPLQVLPGVLRCVAFDANDVFFPRCRVLRGVLASRSGRWLQEAAQAVEHEKSHVLSDHSCA
jgi:hypothetical protein